MPTPETADLPLLMKLGITFFTAGGLAAIAGLIMDIHRPTMLVAMVIIFLSGICTATQILREVWL